MINTLASLFQTILPALMQFISRTVFIAVLGVTYLGINSIFNDLFMMLSLMELGVGSAMTYFLYEPLAKDDKERIKQLMKLYAQLYQAIGFTMAIVGVGLIPFLNLIVHTETSIDNISLFYCLMLINLVSSYFFTYKRSIFTADQKNYVNSINDVIFVTIRHIIQILILYTTHSYIAYLIVAIIITLLSNIVISSVADKKYPYLRENPENKLPISDIKHILSRVSALFGHRLASVVVFGSDNIMMSIFGNIQFVGLYANYALVINAVNMLITPIFNNMVASLGNLSITADKVQVYNVFKRANFLNYILVVSASICMYFLLNPFINLWLGQDYIISQNIVMIIVINFYFSGMRQASLSFSNAKGFFWETRYKPILEAVVDLTFSIILGYFYGPFGILIASSISFMATIWVEPYILYSKWFEINPKVYFIDYIKKMIIGIIMGIIVYLIINILKIQAESFFLLFITVICTVLILIIIFFSKVPEFKFYFQIIRKILKRKNFNL